MAKIELTDRDDAETLAGQHVTKHLRLEAEKLFDVRKAFKTIVGTLALSGGIRLLMFPDSFFTMIAGIAAITLFVRLSFGGTTTVYLTAESQTRLEHWIRRNAVDNDDDDHTTEVS
tara:strand:+ start:2788 stop:3135 length:348 start_codon:yes stop_codon:yes gene_type:complete